MRSAIIATGVVVAVLASIISPPRLLLIWNTTASTPIGLYAITQAIPRRGDLLVVRLPPEMEVLAVSRGILASGTPVLKPVAAVAGDVVCRVGSAVSINGRPVAVARQRDRHGRPLPTWLGCRQLAPTQAFLLARHPDSFDSRYYGALHQNAMLGIARPLITFQKSLIPAVISRLIKT